MTTNEDIQRFQKQETPAEVREKALRETRKIRHWNGERAEGEWIPTSVATDVKRTFESHGKNEEGETVRVTKTEIVYAHGGYRPKFEGEKKTRRAFFFRGARVWRD